MFCMSLTQDQSIVDVANRFEVAADLADIAWGPNFKVSGPGSQAGRALLATDSASTEG